MQIDALLRRCRVALGKTALPKRPDEELVFFEDQPLAGERLLLDTCVILDQLQGRLPREIEARIAARAIHHSPIVLGELSFLFGRLDPADPRTASATRQVQGLLSNIGGHRIFDLTHEDTMRGMILAGCMARLMGHGKEDRRRVQNDAILAAHASRLGCLLVTRNLADFDRLGQLDDRLKVAFYRVPVPVG